MSIREKRKRARRKAAEEKRRGAAVRRHPVLNALAVPEDAAGEEVRVMLLGSGRALIENCLGVAEIGREEIRLTTRRGMMTVRGEELRLEDVRPCALAVTGRIESVALPLSGQEGGGRA